MRRVRAADVAHLFAYPRFPLVASRFCVSLRAREALRGRRARLRGEAAALSTAPVREIDVG